MFATQIRLEDEIAKKVKEQAEKEKRSINNLLNIIIEKYYKDKEGE